MTRDQVLSWAEQVKRAQTIALAPTISDIADTLIDLAAERDRLREALEVFANAGKIIDQNDETYRREGKQPDCMHLRFDGSLVAISLGDLRKAAALLADPAGRHARDQLVALREALEWIARNEQVHAQDLAAYARKTLARLDALPPPSGT